MIKVSVIVPVYNTEKYLRKCLDSLVNQTLNEIEIIVVNDGSPDNSQVIIDEYAEKYPNKIRSFIKENGGQGTARNLALEYAVGEYVGYVDSDDWVDLTMYEEMYESAEKNNSDIVICDMTDHYPNYVVNHNCTKYNSVYEVTPSACNKIFKRECVKDLRFLSVWYEDFNYTTKALMKTGKVSVISKDFYHCHCREISTMSNNNSVKNLEMITVIDDLKEYSINSGFYDENLIKYIIFDHILITSVNRVAKQKSKEKRKVILKFLDYCHKNIKDYKKQPFYGGIPKNRKIVAFLNYHGLYNVSKLLLGIKEKTKRR